MEEAKGSRKILYNYINLYIFTFGTETLKLAILPSPLFNRKEAQTMIMEFNYCIRNFT